MSKLTFQSNIHNYTVDCNSSLDVLNALYQRDDVWFIIDKNVFQAHKERCRFDKIKSLYLLDAFEENKTLEFSLELFRQFTKWGVKRNHTLISIGGGITQDLTGFVASTYYRGIKWTFFPTTLLAQTDSCVGSKTSLNFESFKNLIGSFYPPNQIIIDVDFLNTLPQKDFYSGMGECLKFQLMKEDGDKTIDQVRQTLFGAIELKSKLNNLIHENLAIKSSFIEGDEFDLGRRNLLNYGHCFGHALEATSHYDIPHGLAVNIGILFANIVSSHRGLLSLEKTMQICNELNLPLFPMKIKEEYLNPGMIINALKADKKRQGKDLTIVIPDANLNLIKVSDFTEDEFYKALEKFKACFLNQR